MPWTQGRLAECECHFTCSPALTCTHLVVVQRVGEQRRVVCWRAHTGGGARGDLLGDDLEADEHGRGDVWVGDSVQEQDEHASVVQLRDY